MCVGRIMVYSNLSSTSGFTPRIEVTPPYAPNVINNQHFSQGPSNVAWDLKITENVSATGKLAQAEKKNIIFYLKKAKKFLPGGYIKKCLDPRFLLFAFIFATRFSGGSPQQAAHPTNSSGMTPYEIGFQQGQKHFADSLERVNLEKQVVALQDSLKMLKKVHK